MSHVQIFLYQDLHLKRRLEKSENKIKFEMGKGTYLVDRYCCKKLNMVTFIQYTEFIPVGVHTLASVQRKVESTNLIIV